MALKSNFLQLLKKKDNERTVEIYSDHIIGTKPILIIDGSNIFQQSFFASKGVLYNSKGNETGGIYIFISTMINYIASLNPQKVFCTIDYGMSARRQSLFKNYKIGRKKLRAAKDALLGAEAATEERENYFYQFNDVVQFLKSIPIVLTMLKAVEADSSIGYYVKKIREKKKYNNNPIIIISTDKDFYQLFSFKNLYIFNPRTRQFVDKKNFHCKLDLDSCILPEQLPLLRSIIGDKSDSIPGVLLPKKNKAKRRVGIGGKTISKLYKEAFDGDVLLNTFDDIVKFITSKNTPLKPFEKSILENKKLIDLNIQLMDLIHIDDYMSTSAMMKLDELFEYKPKLNNKWLYDLFNKNDCKSFTMAFQTIKKIFNKIQNGDKSLKSGINWNKI